MRLQQRAEQFLLDKSEYTAATFLHTVTSNTTNSTYIYFMVELADPIILANFTERYHVISVRVSDHEKHNHFDSEWYSKTRVISSEEVDCADDLEDAKDVALGI